MKEYRLCKKMNLKLIPFTEEDMPRISNLPTPRLPYLFGYKKGVYLKNNCRYVNQSCVIQLLTFFFSSKTIPKIYSILLYPITLEGHRGTTDEFATIPFHCVLFSAALVVYACPIFDIVFPPLLLTASSSFSFHYAL